LTAGPRFLISPARSNRVPERRRRLRLAERAAAPLPGTEYRELALRADGTLGDADSTPGQRAYLTLGAGLNRAQPSQADPPSSLTWDTGPLAEDLDVAGNLELRLDATASASHTAWIVVLQDVAPDGTGQDVTARRFRAGHRLRLILTSDDRDQAFPAMMTFRHASVGTSSLNRIAWSSRLVLPALSSPPS
jgi:predicted acyl esterase